MLAPVTAGVRDDGCLHLSVLSSPPFVVVGEQWAFLGCNSSQSKADV